jgi:hypothetical protein
MTWTATIASRGLSSRQRVNTSRSSAVAVEMGGENEVPVQPGGQLRALQAGAEQKPSARRGGIGVARRLFPCGSVSDSQLSSCAS